MSLDERLARAYRASIVDADRFPWEALSVDDQRSWREDVAPMLPVLRGEIAATLRDIAEELREKRPSYTPHFQDCISFSIGVLEAAAIHEEARR